MVKHQKNTTEKRKKSKTDGKASKKLPPGSEKNVKPMVKHQKITTEKRKICKSDGKASKNYHRKEKNM